MDRWGTLACWAQRLKGILEGAALKWIWKCEIGALTHWRVVSKHGRDLQRSVLLCRPEAKSLNLLHDDGQTERKTEPGAEVDNMNLVRQFMQQWADDTFVDSVSRRLLQRLVRLAQKRMLSKALSSWKDERGSSLLCFGRANQDLVVEAVRKNILRLATKCFWGWVAFLHSRQKTTQSFFVVNGMQDRSLVGRSFLQWVAYRRHGDRVFEVEKHIRSSRFVVRQAAISLCRALGTWVKYVRCQRRNDTLVHNALFRIRRMTLRSCLYAWKHIFEISKSLLRRQEIFIQRRAALVGVESVCNWKKRVAERLYIRSVISAKFNKAKRLQVKKAFVSWQVYMEYQKQMTVKMLKVRGKLNVSCRKHVFWAWTSMVSKSKRLKRYVKSLQVRRGMVALKSWQSIMEMLDTIGITVGTSPVALDHVSTSPLASDQPRHPSHFDTHCTASCSTPLGDDSSKNSPIPQKSLEAEPEQCKSLGEVPERFSMTPSSPPLQLARRYLGTPRSHRPANRQVLIAKLEEQEGRMLQLQNKLEEEREAGELKLQKMMIELEQALEHATKARSGTASIEPIPGSRRRSSQPKTPMPTSPSMSPLIGASPLQTHVLSMISGSNNSLFGVPPSPLSPPKERKMLRMRAKRAFNAWRVTGLAGRQQRLLVLQVMMCRKRSNARAVMSIFFTLWLIHLRQSLKISTAGTALYIQYQRLLIESCFYEWAEIPRQSEQVNSSSYLKEPIEWQVLPSPQKMAPPKEDVPSSPCDTPAVDQELLREIQQYREEISTLNFQLQEQQESGKRTSNILQEQLLGMQEEVQNLLSELEREKQRFALCICTTEAATSRSVTSTTSVLSASPSEPRSIFPLHTRALALALWSWRSGVDHGRMLEYSAKCACVQKQKYRCQRFFASWYERSVRTSRIMQAGKSMYRRRMALLARKYLLQMVQHVRINLRLRLVHTPVGELLEHATKESRQQQFSSTEHRVNLQFRRSLNIWSFAFWKGFLRVSKKRRHERAAALRIHSHCQMRNVKKKFGEWSSLSIFDRYLTQRLRLRIQRQIVFILRSSFQRWVLCAQNSKRRVFKGTSVLRSTLISLKRRVFSVFVLHAEILNRLRCSVLQMLFRQSCSRLATAFGAWASLTKQHRAHTLHCTRMLLLFSARRERVVKANVVIALQAEAEKAQNARKRKRKGALASSKCCRRQRLARTMKAWAFHIIQQTHREHTIMCRHESVSKRSFCFTAWKGAGSRNQVGVSSLQTRKCRGMLHHAFFCLCAQGHRRRHVRGVLKRFSSRHEQLKVARVFGKWVRLSQERQWVRRCSLKSCALFEKRVFIRCARYWFAAHLHRRSSHERVASLLVATEQALAIRSLRGRNSHLSSVY